MKRFSRNAIVFISALLTLNAAVPGNAAGTKQKGTDKPPQNSAAGGSGSASSVPQKSPVPSQVTPQVPDAKAGDASTQSGGTSSAGPEPSGPPIEQAPPADDQQILQYGQEITQPAESSVEPEMKRTTGSSTPFSLGANKSVFDAGTQQDTLQQRIPRIDSQFPPMNANINQTQLNAGANQAAAANTMLQGAVKGGLNQVQLQRLAKHDLVLIIDQSGSMRTPDCPVSGVGRTTGTLLNILLGPAASTSRWEWCRDQTLRLAQETRFIANKGFTVILFSVRFAVFQHVTLNQIPLIFTQNVPQSDTNLTEPVTYILNDYIARRNMMQGNVKPLAIAIITDGRPNNEITLRNALVQATQFMRNPDEIKVTFFLIGNSALTGKVFIDDLERNLVRYGARYPIVRSVSFWNLEKVGLPYALADALE